MTVVPEMLPEIAAVVAHGDPLNVSCPVTELPDCWIVPVPVVTIPTNLVEVPVTCQFPVRLGGVELPPQPARQPQNNRIPRSLFMFPPFEVC